MPKLDHADHEKLAATGIRKTHAKLMTTIIKRCSADPMKIGVTHGSG